MNDDDQRRLTKLALLIDGENLPAKFADAVIEKASELGTVAVARVYGHHNNSKIAGWEKIADRLKLTMVDVTKISKAKDSADFKLIVEAMDMLHGRHLDGFCLASSDGDFSALAERIRANVLSIYGFGEEKAPKPYQKVCDDFFDCAELVAKKKAAATAARNTPASKRISAPSPSPQKPGAPKVATPKPSSPKQAPATRTKEKKPRPDAQILIALDGAKKDTDGRALLNTVGTALHEAIPGFDARNYGYKSMKEMIEDMPLLETRRESGNRILVRRRET